MADRLAEDLIRIAQQYPVVQSSETPYGTKYVIDGELLSPSGVRAWVRTVWIIESESEEPRLVTAFPIK